MDEDLAFYDRLGPWVNQQTVLDTLHVSATTLVSLRASRELLAVAFGGQLFYPASEFLNGSVVAGLGIVLNALSAGFQSAESQVAWLAESAYENDARTRWQILRAGNVDAVLRWAIEDAAASLR